MVRCQTNSIFNFPTTAARTSCETETDWYRGVARLDFFHYIGLHKKGGRQLQQTFQSLRAEAKIMFFLCPHAGTEGALSRLSQDHVGASLNGTDAVS